MGAGMMERPAPTPLPTRGDDTAAGLASLQEIVREFRARLEARRGDAREADAEREGVVAQPAKAVCPICGGAGYLRQELPPGDPFFGQPVPCKCKERELEERRWQELKRFSSLEPFADKTFETFHATVPGVREAYDIARRYASDPSQGWLVLSGPYGCGKTHLAAAVAHHHLATQRPVFFAVVPDLLHQLRAAFGPNSEISHDAMFDAIREVELLVLDDLGAENGTAWAQEKLFQIINYRYNYRMPTVVTTNHQLQTRLDERLRSRLSDLSFVQYVVIKSGDYRPRNTRRQR
jgi:DNA replication protein DnaC